MPKLGTGMRLLKIKDILLDSNSWWKYNFDIEVEDQGHTEFMNVQGTLYHGDTLTYQTNYDYVKGQKSWGLNTKPCHTRSKVNVESGSYMYLTHPLIVINPCAKYGMSMSKLTEVTGRTWRHG